MAEQTPFQLISPPAHAMPAFTQSCERSRRREITRRQRGRNTVIAREFRDHREVNRLLEEIRRIQTFGCVAVVVIGKRCQHDHRCVLVHETRSGKNLQTTVAVPAEPQIGDDQVERCLAEDCDLGVGEGRGRNDGDVIGGEEIDE